MLEKVIATEETLKEWIFENKKQRAYLWLKTAKKSDLHCSFVIETCVMPAAKAVDVTFFNSGNDESSTGKATYSK